MNAKKLSKRIIASVVTLMLVLGCFLIPTALTAKAADGVEVVFHYLRTDGDYTDWGLWAWGEGGGTTFNGDTATSGFMFTDNGDAKGAETTVIAQGVNTLGFIVRLGEWKAKEHRLLFPGRNQEGQVDLERGRVSESVCEPVSDRGSGSGEADTDGTFGK